MTGDTGEAGVLYIVSTPIGNLDDMTVRARDVLASVDLVAAEDTRHTAGLLRHYLINTPMVSLHEHNESSRARKVLSRIAQGESVALVSDAGTPLISDPGYRLVRLARDSGIKVVPVPGASALLSAICVSGIQADRFVFEGFLPASKASRRRALSVLDKEQRTLVFYEAPHRILHCLQDMGEIFGGQRETSVCRELTKRYETIKTAPLSELIEWMEADSDQRRGEFVIIVAGAGSDLDDPCRPEWVDAVHELYGYMPLKRAAQIIAGVTGARSQLLYRLARRDNSK